MRGLFVAATTIMGLVAGGCVSPSGVEPDQAPNPDTSPRSGPPDDFMPEGPRHDHTLPDGHDFLWHYETTAHDPMLSNTVAYAGLHALDLQAGYLFGAVWASRAAGIDGGIRIWDLTDPTTPSVAGSLNIPGHTGGDRSLSATSDGNFVVLGLEPVTCFGQPSATAAAVPLMLIDTHDKSLPIIADVVSVTGVGLGTRDAALANNVGVHSVEVHNFNGTEYVFAYQRIYRIDMTEQGARLVLVSWYPTGHDTYVRDNPNGTVWALTPFGYGLGDFVINDVTDPSHPKEVSRWNIPERGVEGPARYFHTADIEWFDDRPIITLVSEDSGKDVAVFWVLDASDPAELEVLSEWHNPWNRSAGELTFSLHNQRFHDDGMMTMAAYHAGILQFDLRTPESLTEPSPVAYAATGEGSTGAYRDPVDEAFMTAYCQLGEYTPGARWDAPFYMDVEPASDGSGILYAADFSGGLYTFAPTPDHPVFGIASG